MAGQAGKKIWGTLTDKDTGIETTITVEQGAQALASVQNDALEGSYSVIRGYGEGLVEFDLHPESGFVNEAGATLLLTEGFEDAALAPGRYFVLYPSNTLTYEPFTKAELAHVKADKLDGLLLATDSEQAMGDGLTPIPVTITPRDNDGNIPEDAPYDALELWLLLSRETDAYTSLWDLMQSILLQAAANEALKRLQKQGDVTISKEVQGEPGGLKDQLAIVFHGTRELNDLARTDSRAQGVKSVELKQDLYGGGKTRNYIQTGQTNIIFDTPDLSGMRISGKTDRTLTALIGALPEEARYTRNEVVRAATTIPEVMELYGQTSRRDLRRSLKEDLNAIAAIRLSASEGEDAFIGIPIVGGAYGIDKKGNVYFTFSPDFIRLISGDSAFTEYLDPAAFKGDMGRNPHYWHIYKKLASHYSANMGKKNEYTLKVKSLLEYLPKVPSYDEVAAGNRNFTGRIIEPVERDLDALVALGVLTEWDYCHANGEPLADHEQDKRLNANGDATALPYEIAVECNLTWRFAHEYHRDELIEKKREHREKILAGAEAKKDAARKSKERIRRKKEDYIAKAEAEEERKTRRKTKNTV